MSQIFSSDAQARGLQNLTGSVTLDVGDTNPLQPPFGTCKAKVWGLVEIELGADQTEAILTLVRNVNSEALVIAQTHFVYDPTVSTTLTMSVAGIDSIPDPRAVTYQLQAMQQGGADNGFVSYAYIEATLLSG